MCAHFYTWILIRCCFFAFNCDTQPCRPLAGIWPQNCRSHPGYMKITAILTLGVNSYVGKGPVTVKDLDSLTASHYYINICFFFSLTKQATRYKTHDVLFLLFNARCHSREKWITEILGVGNNCLLLITYWIDVDVTSYTWTPDVVM